MKRQILQFALIIVTAVTLMFISPAAIGRAGRGDNPSVPPVTSPPPPNSSSRSWSAAGRIHFAPGTTSAVVSGYLAAYDHTRYVLRAFGGQLMDITLSAPQGARLSVTTSWGYPLIPVTGSDMNFRGYLPWDGDYFVTVTSNSKPVSYSMYISIPQRISFALGATSATLDGHLNPFQSHDYILRAQAGQLMEINITPDNVAENPDSNLHLVIYGVDGTVLKSGMGEGSFFRGELPASQDYFLTVRAGEKAVSFTMNVIIPQRISFRPGAVSGSVAGRLGAHQSQYYVLRAFQNQTMQVEVTPGNNVQLIIYGADGTVLRSGMGEGASFVGVLPGTQDYILVLRAGADPVAYTLTVTIR